MLDKSRLYMVINYGKSPVGVASRSGSMMIAAADKDGTPSEQPLSLDEIVEINSMCGAFKLGLLRFEKEFEEEIYELLRIHNWRDIMTDDEIEETLLNPSLESLQKIIDIRDPLYFERVRGIYTGLKSVAADVPGKVDMVINERTKEFAKKITTSSIQLVPKDNGNAEMEKLKEQMAKMAEEVAQMRADAAAAKEPVEEAPAEAPAPKKKPAAKKKTTTSKKTAKPKNEEA